MTDLTHRFHSLAKSLSMITFHYMFHWYYKIFSCSGKYSYLPEYNKFFALFLHRSSFSSFSWLYLLLPFFSMDVCVRGFSQKPVFSCQRPVSPCRYTDTLRPARSAYAFFFCARTHALHSSRCERRAE